MEENKIIENETVEETGTQTETVETGSDNVVTENTDMITLTQQELDKRIQSAEDKLRTKYSQRIKALEKQIEDAKPVEKSAEEKDYEQRLAALEADVTQGNFTLDNLKGNIDDAYSGIGTALLNDSELDSPNKAEYDKFTSSDVGKQYMNSSILIPDKVLLSSTKLIFELIKLLFKLGLKLLLSILRLLLLLLLLLYELLLLKVSSKVLLIEQIFVDDLISVFCESSERFDDV